MLGAILDSSHQHTAGYGVKGSGSADGDALNDGGAAVPLVPARTISKELETEFLHFLLESFETKELETERNETDGSTTEDPKGPLDLREPSDCSDQQLRTSVDNEDCATSTCVMRNEAPSCSPHNTPVYEPAHTVEEMMNADLSQKEISINFDKRVQFADIELEEDIAEHYDDLRQLDVLTSKLLEHADSLDTALQCTSVCEPLTDDSASTEEVSQTNKLRTTRSVGQQLCVATNEVTDRAPSVENGVLTRSRIQNDKDHVESPKSNKRKGARFHGTENKLSAKSVESSHAVTFVKVKYPKVQKTGEHNTKASREVRFACRNCNSSSTPQWRMGPAGPKTLCNACGVRYRKGLPLDGSS